MLNSLRKPPPRVVFSGSPVNRGGAAEREVEVVLLADVDVEGVGDVVLDREGARGGIGVWLGIVDDESLAVLAVFLEVVRVVLVVVEVIGLASLVVFTVEALNSAPLNPPRVASTLRGSRSLFGLRT